MLSTLCVLITVSASLGDATILKTARDAASVGGLEFAIGGGGWGRGSGISGGGGGNGGFTLGYTVGGLKTPVLPVVGLAHIGYTGHYHPLSQDSFSLQGQGYLQGQAGYLHQPQGNYPPKQGISPHGIGYPLYGIGSLPNREGNGGNIVPQGGNVGGFVPHVGFPHHGGLGGYIPQIPQAGYPSQGGFIPPAGYPSQGGGYRPQVPQGTGPYSGQGVGGGAQSGGEANNSESPAIDPRNEKKHPVKPTSQGRRRTTITTVEPIEPEEEQHTTESSEEGDEENADENAIPEENE